MKTNWEEYFLDVALRCAQQGSCLRHTYGAVIVDEYKTIVSTGYTGMVKGAKHCTELGVCWRKANNIKSGTMYEKCRSVHAEANSLLQAGKMARGCDLYLAGLDYDTGKELKSPRPCYMCAKLILNAGIRFVVTRNKVKGVDRLDAFMLYEQKEIEALGVVS